MSRLFLGLMDPDPYLFCTDPAPDPLNIKQGKHACRA
jgi:hypothetical protein